MSKNYRLTNLQKTMVYEVVQKSIFDPVDDFIMEVRELPEQHPDMSGSPYRPARRVHMLIYRHEPIEAYRFIFDRCDRDDGRFNPVYSPGAEALEECEKRIDWEGVLEVVTEWLTYLQFETQLGDPWQGAVSSNALLEKVREQNDGEGFTEAQQNQIATGLVEIERYLVEKLGDQFEEQRTHIDQQFDDLRHTVVILSRRAWLQQLYGVFELPPFGRARGFN